jgi:hypothetical protein
VPLTRFALDLGLCPNEPRFSGSIWEGILVKKLIAPFLATILVLVAASTALAGKPDSFYREQSSGSEYDSFVSELCGFDVWLDYRTDFYTVVGKTGSYFHAERFRTGPGGSIKQVVHLTFRYPDGFQVIGDPESGSWIEVFHEIGQGSLVWSTPEDGVIYRAAGRADVTATLTITPEGEDFQIVEEIYSGQMPGGLSEGELNTLLCDTLG